MICGTGTEIIKKYSASQIMKNEVVLPKSTGRAETLEKLKVNGTLFLLNIMMIIIISIFQLPHTY